MIKRFTIFPLIILCVGGKAIAQQYDWNKASQKQREKDNAAYIEAMKPEKKKRSENSSGSGSGSNNYYDEVAAAERKKRADAMNAAAKEVHRKKVQEFLNMSALVPKVKENFGVLMILALDAGLTDDEAYNINQYLSPNNRSFNRSDRKIFYPDDVPKSNSGPAKVYTPAELAQMEKNIANSRRQDSINRIKQAIENQHQKKLLFNLNEASAAYERKDFASASLYFDSGLAWKNLQRSSYHEYILKAGYSARYLGNFEKSMAIFLKYNFDFEYRSATTYPEFASELLKYEASISALYAGDFNKAIALGSYHTRKSLEFESDFKLRNSKSDNISLLTSYCNFHLQSADAATQLSNLPYYIDDRSDWSARLVRMYYTFKTNDTKKLKEQMKLFAQTHTAVAFQGDADIKLANMLYYESKRLITTDAVSIQALYLLDLAIDLLPANKEFIQTRYNTNTALKRTKFAEADARLLGL